MPKITPYLDTFHAVRVLAAPLDSGAIAQSNIILIEELTNL